MIRRAVILLALLAATCRAEIPLVAFNDWLMVAAGQEPRFPDAYLDLDASIGVTLSGDRVVSWADANSGWALATNCAGNAAYRPQYVASYGTAQRPALYFNDTNGLSIGSDFGVTTALTLVVVANVTNAMANNGRLAGPEAVWILYIHKATDSLRIYGSTLDTAFSGGDSANTAMGSLKVFSTTFNSGYSLTNWMGYRGTNWVGYINSASALNSQGTTPFTIGGRASDQARGLKGYIGRVLVWKRTLSPSELLSVQQKLIAQWRTQ